MTMKAQYLPSVYQTHTAHYAGQITIDKTQLRLKRREVTTLRRMCELLADKISDNYQVFDGYYVSFSIPQLSNEFDLLRFGANYIVNIELKSPLSEDRKIEKIKNQMKKHQYYLNFLGKDIKIFTYIEQDGFYRYNAEEDSVDAVDVQEVISILLNQDVEIDVDLKSLFKPSNYLVSPFNKVEEFIRGEYFLTRDQEKKKNEILNSLASNESLFYCISADAGTGKTLLVYDIAKTYMQSEKKVLVLHCANLNEGQTKLKFDYHWNIKSIGNLKHLNCNVVVGEQDLIIVDESQRIDGHQLDQLVQYAYENKIAILFSYDTKQYLREGENRDVFQYLVENYPQHTAQLRKLTKSIRTNQEMMSFIENVMSIGKVKNNLNYENISIDYFDSVQDAKNYMSYLNTTGEWQAITFTSSFFEEETIDSLACLCEENAHGVIGQEFERVVFAMDLNFQYNERNKLTARKTYYSLEGMLYQIVTRAVSELKIIVIENYQLYEKLVYIKSMGTQQED